MTHKSPFLLGSVSALALAASPALAQDVFDLGEVTVFANQTPTAVDRTGATVEIIDSQQIEEQGSNSLSTIIDTVPGVSVTSNGGLGKQTNVRIRGLSDRYVSVRINGIDVTDPASTQTQYNWGGLSTAAIGRVEILKGSQSALYGSEAIGGVINITTARQEEIGTTYRFGGEVGSYDTYSADFGVTTRTERADLSFSLSTLQSDGFSAADEKDGNSEEDGFDGITSFLSGSYALTDAVRMGFDLIYMNEETNIDAFGGPGGDADRPFFTDRRGARVYAEIDGGAVDHILEASYFETERLDPDTPFGSPFFEGDRTEVRYRGFAALDATQLAFGAEYSEETALFSNGRASYDVFSLFGEAQYAVNADLDVSAALRVDDHSEFGTEPTGRLAFAWRPNVGTVVRGSLATGFRAPSLNELFGPFNFGTPNPDLDPETSRSAELGIEHTYTTGAQIRATAFYTEIDDLISYPLNGYEQIDGTSKTQGIELSGSLPLGERFSLLGNYTYTDATDPDGERLIRVPEHDLLLGLRAAFTDRLSGQVLLTHVAERLDGFAPPTDMDDYTVVDLTLDYAVTDSATVYFRVENVTDEEYQTVRGFGTSDRAFYVGVRATF